MSIDQEKHSRSVAISMVVFGLALVAFGVVLAVQHRHVMQASRVPLPPVAEADNVRLVRVIKQVLFLLLIESCLLHRLGYLHVTVKLQKLLLRERT